MPKHIPPGQEHNYIRREVRGKVFWVRRSKPKRWSRQQKKQRSRFAEAAAYAKRVMSDPAMLAPYAAVAKKRKAWRVFPIITRDFMRAPVVREIELRDAEDAHPCVAVYAVDDFEVVAVAVVVRTQAGALIWRGAAGYDAPWWKVTLPRALGAEEEIVVDAFACDRPGNTGSATATLSIARAKELRRREKEAEPARLAKRAARKARRG